MTPESFQGALPGVATWIRETLLAHAAEARPVSSLRFERLPQYFSPELLASAKFVPVDRVPVPPLARLGLPGFAEFEAMEPAGITYMDTYFVRREQAKFESLHFHELVHVLQWRELGPALFLAAYARGLEECGYGDSPLEVMAYRLERIFQNGSPIFDVEQFVRRQLARKGAS